MRFDSESLPLTQIHDIYQRTHLCRNPITFFDYSKLHLFFTVLSLKKDLLSLSISYRVYFWPFSTRTSGIESGDQLNVATQVMLTYWLCCTFTRESVALRGVGMGPARWGLLCCTNGKVSAVRTAYYYIHNQMYTIFCVKCVCYLN